MPTSVPGVKYNLFSYSQLMIIFLYGKDTYRLRRKAREIIEQYKKTNKSGLNLKLFDGKSSDTKEISEAIFASSMFKEKKLIVIEGLFANQEAKQLFLQNFDRFNNSKDVILLSESGEPRSNDGLFKLLLKGAKTQKFDLLEGPALWRWIQREAGKYGMSFEKEALTLLADLVGNDLWRASNEIRKLASYKLTSKPRVVSLRDLEALVKLDVQTDIFKALDSLARGEKKEAALIFRGLLEKGEQPLPILAMIAFQFRNILAVKDLMSRSSSDQAIFSNLNLHPFVIKKSYYLAQRFTLEQLKKIHQKIFRADIDIKTGRLDPGVALDLLIAEI